MVFATEKLNKYVSAASDLEPKTASAVLLALLLVVFPVKFSSQDFPNHRTHQVTKRGPGELKSEHEGQVDRATCKTSVTLPYHLQISPKSGPWLSHKDLRVIKESAASMFHRCIQELPEIPRLLFHRAQGLELPCGQDCTGGVEGFCWKDPQVWFHTLCS